MPASKGGARPRQLPLLAGRRHQCRRQLHGRRRHRDRVVPLRQVARRLVPALRLQHHHRQGRHDVRGLSQLVRAEQRDLSHHRRLRHRRAARPRHQARRRRLLARGAGLAQAVWVLDVENFGPFLVESDLAGNSLFERENAKIAPGSRSSTRAPGRRRCAATARPTTRPKK